MRKVLNRILKKRPQCTRISILCALFASLAFCKPIHANELSVIADEWCPLNCEPWSTHPGYGIEILRQIFQPNGIAVTYGIETWSRSVHEVKLGRFDAIVGAAPTEIEGFVIPDEEIGTSANGIARHISKDWHYQGLSSLENKLLAVVRDYYYGDGLDEYIQKNLKENSRIYVQSGETALETNLRLLAAKRVDLIIDDQSVLAYKINEMKLHHIILSAGTTGPAEPIYVGFAPTLHESKAYKVMFDSGIQKMRATGQLAEILSHYGLQDWKP